MEILNLQGPNSSGRNYPQSGGLPPLTNQTFSRFAIPTVPNSDPNITTCAQALGIIPNTLFYEDSYGIRDCKGQYPYAVVGAVRMENLFIPKPSPEDYSRIIQAAHSQLSDNERAFARRSVTPSFIRRFFEWCGLASKTVRLTEAVNQAWNAVLQMTTEIGRQQALISRDPQGYHLQNAATSNVFTRPLKKNLIGIYQLDLLRNEVQALSQSKRAKSASTAWARQSLNLLGSDINKIDIAQVAAIRLFVEKEQIEKLANEALPNQI